MPTQSSSRPDSIKKLKNLYVQNKIVSDVPIVGNIGDIGDVTINTESLQNNQVLTYSNSLWVNKDTTNVVINSIDDLADVSINTDRPDGSILSFNGTNWVDDANITMPNGSIKNSGLNVKLSGNFQFDELFPTVVNCIDIGSESINQGYNAISIGYKYNIENEDALPTNQGVCSIAIGTDSGFTDQGDSSIAIGNAAGYCNQNSDCIAIGRSAGGLWQHSNSVAIGTSAGYYSQKNNAIAIGSNAGISNQNVNSIAIGTNAGSNSQKSYSVAIGSNAGYCNLGKYSVAIGTNASYNGKDYSNTIVINATGVELNPTESNAFFISPVRGEARGLGVGYLVYDPATKELTYSTT